MSDTQSQIAFQQLGLGSVLKQYRLTVPPNQREYAWTDREVMPGTSRGRPTGSQAIPGHRRGQASSLRDIPVRMVGEVEDWMPHHIARRQEELAGLALIAWPV